MGNDLNPEKSQEGRPINMKNIKRYQKKEDAICKLKTGSGTGFFCQIEINDKTMKCLFTNNHVLNEEKIQIGSKIKLLHKNIIKYIEITNNRFVCTNSKLDYTCIEIFDDENFDNFFIIDPHINCNNSNEEYKDDYLGIMQCPGNEDVSIAEGRIIEIKNNSKIIHSSPTEPGSSGSPIILSTRNLSIIGIHQGSIKNKDYNRGVYFKPILDDIQKQFSNSSKYKKWINPKNIFNRINKFYDKYIKELFQKNENRE